MSRQNGRGTEIAKFASVAPLMTVQLTDNTDKVVPPPKVMSLSLWRGGTGIAKFAGVAHPMTFKGQSQLKWCPPVKWCLRGEITLADATPLPGGLLY